MKFSLEQQKSSKLLKISTSLLSVIFSPTLLAQAESTGSGNPESFPWLIIPILLVFLAAMFFWFGRSIFGRKSCAIGAVRRRTFVGVVFPPTAASQAAFEPTKQLLKELRAFPWITFDVPVAVLGPGVKEVTEKKVCLNRVRGQIKTTTNTISNYQQTDHGVDIIAKLTSEIGTRSLLSGNYWKKKTRLIRLLPANEEESHARESGKGGWNPAVVQDPAWLSKKLPSIVDEALNLCGEGAREGPV
jgi:hypothetical protein